MTKQRTIALSAIGIAAALALFASAPLLAAPQAHAFRGFGLGGGFDGGYGWAATDVPGSAVVSAQAAGSPGVRPRQHLQARLHNMTIFTQFIPFFYMYRM